MTDPSNNRDVEPDDEAADDKIEDTAAEDTENAGDTYAEDDLDEDIEEDEDAEEDAEEDDESDSAEDKRVPSGKASRSGNPARAAEADEKPRKTRPVKPKKVGNRWAAPAMLASAGIGLLWIVLYYLFANTENPIPGMNELGDWNLIIGMGFIVAAFGFSMKWE